MAIRKSSNSGIPFGNTAGRPTAATGQPYFNGETGRLELYTSTGWQNIVQETPGVASVSGTYNESAGSGTFTVYGTNFVDGSIAYAVGTNGTEYQASTTTYNSIVQVTAVFSNLSTAYEPYDIKIVNPSSLFGLLPDAFYINDSPVWATSSGSLGTWDGSSIQLSATDDESNTITYSVTSGSLPTGLSLSSSGLISGTATGNPETSTFTVSASDGINTAVTRSFSITTPTIVTGGEVTVSGDYRIHTFTSTGALETNASSLTVDYLVIAGGGGGSSQHGGGGGAGGYRTSVGTSGQNSAAESSLTLTGSTSYTVTVGGGGAATSNGTTAPNGENSSFSTITSIGGGGGTGWGTPNTVGNGGSGGGSSLNASGGTGTNNQGYDGGSTGTSNTFPNGGSGGGGAGQAGENATNLSRAGNGGNGLSSSITGSAVTRAGGGGGGAHQPYAGSSGGTGGGGAGATAVNGNINVGIDADENTGSGGGGSSGASQTGGNGGSGIVIVRYLKSVVGL